MTAIRRIALVTTDLDLPPFDTHGDVDRAPLTDAFARRGARVDHPRWDDPSVEWSGYDALLLRSPWDYATRTDEFLSWLAARDDQPVWNEPALVRWNIDKRYLDDLAARGVRVVPTHFADTIDDVITAVDHLDSATGVTTPGRDAGSGVSEIVIKPSISAGSRLTGRFRDRRHAMSELAAEILREGRTVMVQPCIASVAVDGELAVVAIDGVVSHTVRKGPILGPDGTLRGGCYREDIDTGTLDDDSAALVAAATNAIRDIRRTLGLDGDPLYARYDLVETDSGPLLLEAELFEPSLFFDALAGSADRFARAVWNRLG